LHDHWILLQAGSKRARLAFCAEDQPEIVEHPCGFGLGAGRRPNDQIFEAAAAWGRNLGMAAGLGELVASA
jgi:hypothetical protein